MVLSHGGDLASATATFGIPRDQWLDVSTGISPWSWPVPPVPERVWQTLPNGGDGLEQAAASYYGCPESALLAIPGSQYAIQHIPGLLPVSRVAMPVRGYAEHRAAWLAAGHQLVDYRSTEELQRLIAMDAVNHAVVINPNNPTAEVMDKAVLQAIHRAIQLRDGWLVVDEAFADPLPDNSLASLCPLPGLLVLRSLGKFFGLAGVRLGFMLGPDSFLQALADGLSPWSVSHPARWLGGMALSDVDWQNHQRQRLLTEAAVWRAELTTLLPELRFSSTPLFVTGTGDDHCCQRVYRGLGKCGILVRHFSPSATDSDSNSAAVSERGQGMLRFGLSVPTDRAGIVMSVKEVIAEEVSAKDVFVEK